MQDATMQDTIVKSVRIDAAPEAVWAALVDHGAFGTWFRARVEGPFEAGRAVWLESTYPGHVGVRFWLRPVILDPPRRFAFDWPAGDEGSDTPQAPTTRVVFELTGEAGGTRVTVTESGFAALPPEVAARQYPANTEGWEIQTANLKAHVEGHVAA